MAEIDIKRKAGDIGDHPMNNVKIEKGAIVMLNASGYGVEGADTASCVFAGIARETVDNSAGAAGDKRIEVTRKGTFLFKIAAAARTNVGTAVFIVDDQTVGLVATTTNDVPCGKIAQYEDATHVWVDIDRDLS